MDLNNRKRTPPTHQHLSIFFEMTLWHWIIVLATVFGTIIEAILPHSFGTIIANFKSLNHSSTLNQDSSFKSASQFQLNWLPVTSSALPCIFLPIFTMIVTRYTRYYQIISLSAFILIAMSSLLSSLVENWAMMFLAYSVLYSIGSSLLLAVIVTILAEYYPVEHRFHVFATSLYQIGYALGAMVGNPLVALLIVRFSWRNAFKYLSIIQLLSGLIVSLIMKPYRSQDMCLKLMKVDEENELELEINRDALTESSTYLDDTTNSIASVGSIATRGECWLWLFAKWLNYTCWYGLRTNISSYLVKAPLIKLNLQEAAKMMMYYAGAEIVIALIVSSVGDRLRGKLVWVHLIAAAAMAVLTGCFPMSGSEKWSTILIMILIGSFVQVTLSFGYPASIEVMNSRYNQGNMDAIVDIRESWVITNVAAGLGIITSPLISGLMMDKFGFETFFYTLSGCWVAQTILYGLIIVIIMVTGLQNNSEYQEFRPTK